MRETARAAKKTAMKLGANIAWSSSTRPATGPKDVPGIRRPRKPYQTWSTGATRTAPSRVMFPSRTLSNARGRAVAPSAAPTFACSGSSSELLPLSERPSNRVWHATSPAPTMPADVSALVATLTIPECLHV